MRTSALPGDWFPRLPLALGCHVEQVFDRVRPVLYCYEQMYELLRAVSELKSAVTAFQPGHPSHAVVATVEALAEAERLCAAAKARAAAWLDAEGGGKIGQHSTADWLARTSGTSVGAAKGSIG